MAVKELAEDQQKNDDLIRRITNSDKKIKLLQDKVCRLNFFLSRVIVNLLGFDYSCFV